MKILSFFIIICYTVYMAELNWKPWKENKTIIDKFLKDYNLTLLEAALATTESKTPKTFVDYKKNPEKASLYFLQKLSEFTDTPIEDLFEKPSNDQTDFQYTNKMDKIVELHKFCFSYLKSSNKSQSCGKNIQPFFNTVRLPIISSLGDEFSGKRKFFSSFEPCLNVKIFQESICFVVHEDYGMEAFKNTFGENSFETIKTTKFIKLTNQRENFFDPRQIINEYYLKNWEIAKDNNGVIVIFSKNNVFKDFILIDYPEYRYEETTEHKIKDSDIKLLIKYQYFADYCFYFGAISRFLTILDTPILRFLLTLSGESYVKFFVTKLELRKDIKNIDFTVQNLKENNSYSLDIPFSFNGSIGKGLNEGNSIKENIIMLDDPLLLLQEIGDFLDFYLSSYIFNDINCEKNLIDNFKVEFINTLSQENDYTSKDIESVKNNLRKGFDELYKIIIGESDKKSIKVISEWMSDQDSVEQKINKESFIKILDFVYDYISINTERELNKIKEVHHEEVQYKDFIVASLFLYFGNNILPFINNETSFSKGTYDTWKKKLYKKIPITKELYDSLTNMILSILEV